MSTSTMAPPTEIDDLIPDLMKLKMALEKVSARFEHFPEESDERTISAGVMEVQMIIELLFEQTRATIDMKKSAKATFEQLESKKQEELKKVRDSRDSYDQAKKDAENASKQHMEKRTIYEKKLEQLERDAPRV